LRKFEVTILGSGITGLAVAEALVQRGIKSIAIVGRPPSLHLTTSNHVRYVSTALEDNATRIVHASQQSGFKALKEITSHGYRLCRQWIPSVEGQVLRAALTEAEAKEMDRAKELLISMAYPCCLELSHSPNNAGILKIQNDDDSIMPIEGPKILIHLKKSVGPWVSEFYDHCLNIELSRCGGPVKVSLNQSTLKSEFLVIASPKAVNTLMQGQLPHVMIPYEDQWSQFRGDISDAILKLNHLVLINHGHTALFCSDKKTIFARGSRFTRHQFGIGGQRRLHHAASIEFHGRLLKKLGVKDLQYITSVPVVGWKPCDDSPIIGPLAASSRILIASGFSNHGVALGIGSAQMIADLIASGQSKWSCGTFYPSRFSS
jgi:hypothetical protein